MNQQNNLSFEDKISVRTKLYYGLGSFGSYIAFAIVLNSTIFYYHTVLKLPEIIVLQAFIFYTILNAINGILFGWLSDKTKTSTGRRIPYLRLLAPFLAVAFIFVWLSPSIGEITEIGVLIWMVIFLVLFDIFYTSTNMAYSALGQELSMDQKERANIQVFIMLFGIIGVVISLFVPLYIFENLGRFEFVIFTIILAVIILITMLITSYTVKERLEFSHIDTPLGLRASVKHTIKNKSFLTTAFVNFWIQFVQAVIFGEIFFFITAVFVGYDSTDVLILMGAFLLSGLFIGIWYTLKINKTKGLKPALLRSLLFVGCGLLLVGILPGLFATSGFFLFGLGLFGIMALINTAYGAVADEDETKTGTRREAAIFGVNAFITKPAQSLGGVFIAFMLVMFSNEALGFRLAIGIIPGLIMLGSLLIFRIYPLHGKYLNEIKSKMRLMHKEKREKLKALQDNSN